MLAVRVKAKIVNEKAGITVETTVLLLTGYEAVPVFRYFCSFWCFCSGTFITGFYLPSPTSGAPYR